jgi:hypothetical protein
MEMGIYEPPRGSPSPPPPSPRKIRSAILMVALFIGAFVISLAIFSRHELAAMISRHAAQPAVTATRSPAPEITQKKANAAKMQQPPAQSQQATAMPPSVFQ